VILENVVGARPVIALRQGQPGAAWNFERVFAELLDDRAPPWACPYHPGAQPAAAGRHAWT
jgi:hypothetical protein